MEDLPHEPEEKGSLTGYAAIKYTAIVIIVIAILVFLAAYVLPLVKDLWTSRASRRPRTRSRAELLHG